MSISEQVIEVIDALAAKLGVAAEYLYPLMVRQAYVDGYKGIGALVISIICIVVSVKTIHFVCVDKKGRTEPRISASDDDAQGGWIFVVFMMGIMLIGSIAALSCFYSSTIDALLNPEWYAITNLLKSIK